MNNSKSQSVHCRQLVTAESAHWFDAHPAPSVGLYPTQYATIDAWSSFPGTCKVTKKIQKLYETFNHHTYVPLLVTD